MIGVGNSINPYKGENRAQSAAFKNFYTVTDGLDGYNREDAIQAIDICIIQYLSIFFNRECPITYLPVTVTREVTDEFPTTNSC